MLPTNTDRLPFSRGFSKTPPDSAGVVETAYTYPDLAERLDYLQTLLGTLQEPEPEPQPGRAVVVRTYSNDEYGEPVETSGDQLTPLDQATRLFGFPRSKAEVITGLINETLDLMLFADYVTDQLDNYGGIQAQQWYLIGLKTKGAGRFPFGKLKSYGEDDVKAEIDRLIKKMNHNSKSEKAAKQAKYSGPAKMQALEDIGFFGLEAIREMANTESGKLDNFLAALLELGVQNAKKSRNGVYSKDGPFYSEKNKDALQRMKDG